MPSIPYEVAKSLRQGSQVYFNRSLYEGLKEWHSQTGSPTGWYTLRGVEVRLDNVLFDIGDDHGCHWSYRWFSSSR